MTSGSIDNAATRQWHSARWKRQILAVLLLLLAWQSSVWMIYGSSAEGRLLPSPLQVLATFRDLIASGELLRHTALSMLRVLTGLAIAISLAIPLGLLIGWFPTARDMGEIIIELFRPIPPLAWIPLAVLWFGLRPTSAIFIIVIGAFFPTLISTIAGVRGVERGYLEAAYTLGANRSFDLCRKVVIPAALPSILTGVRISAGLAWMSVVAAEMIAIDSGLGYMILDARQLFRPDVVISGMVAIGMIGFGMDRLLFYFENLVLRWRRTGRAETAG
jgi:ABC-type nitrate/sulfonate/bicarbonate transport system permease component